MIRYICLALIVASIAASGWSANSAPRRLAEGTPVARSQTARPGGDLPGEPAIQLVKVAGGFNDAVNLAVPNDGSARLFIADRYGVVRIVDADGNLLEDAFIDITHKVQWGHPEQGLLGIAFHPDYARNGRFYVSFTEIESNADLQVMEFRVAPGNPNLADLASGRLILTVDKPYRAHNGGTIRFGPDGYLYVGIGDGGLPGDPLGNGQNLNTPLGTILRLDVDAEDGKPYEIPIDNPFVLPPPTEGLTSEDDGSSRNAKRRDRRTDELSSTQTTPPSPRGIPELWAFGFRNPWQFSFDSMTGDLYIADVGEISTEEINFQPAGRSGGQNYGWNVLEGTSCFPAGALECPRPPGAIDPVAEYQHGDDGCAVIGIGMYRGTEFPNLDGIYFSGDRCSGKIWGLARDPQGNWQFEQLLDTELWLSGAGVDMNGALYVTASGCTCDDPDNFRKGSVWQLVPADQVPIGAETAPLSGVLTPEATPIARNTAISTRPTQI